MKEDGNGMGRKKHLKEARLHEFLGTNIMSPKTRLSSKSDTRFHVRTVTSGRDGVLERLVNVRE